MGNLKTKLALIAIVSSAVVLSHPGAILNHPRDTLESSWSPP